MILDYLYFSFPSLLLRLAEYDVVVTTYSLVSKEIPVQKEEAEKPNKDDVVRNIFMVKIFLCHETAVPRGLFDIVQCLWSVMMGIKLHHFVFIRLLRHCRLYSGWSGREWFWMKPTTSRTQKCRRLWPRVSWRLVPAGPLLELPSRITCWTCTLCSSKTKNTGRNRVKKEELFLIKHCRNGLVDAL